MGRSAADHQGISHCLDSGHSASDEVWLCRGEFECCGVCSHIVERWMMIIVIMWWDGVADALQAGASQFEASAGKLKRKFWWKNMKVNWLPLSRW